MGAVMAETWRLHQELDPHCSNAEVDRLFARVHHLSCGYKLAGAGGGGFAMIMAKDAESARQIKSILNGIGDPVRVAQWSIAT